MQIFIYKTVWTAYDSRKLYFDVTKYTIIIKKVKVIKYVLGKQWGLLALHVRVYQYMYNQLWCCVIPKEFIAQGLSLFN